MQIAHTWAHGSPQHSLQSLFQRPARSDQQTPVARSVSAAQSTSLELTVTTAEGDKVTLSAEAVNALSLSSDGSSRTLATTRQLSLSISVEGDLNPEELDDIRKLALALGKGVHQAKQGNLAQALQTVSRNTDESTIAGFQFRYEQVAALEYRQSAYDHVSALT